MASNSIKERPTVLVIDDDEPTRALVAAALTDEGYTVVAAANAHDGAQLAQQHCPALILLDLFMPGGGGLNFLEIYRANGSSRAPVVVMTAASDLPGQMIHAIADGVLAKPFELDDLIEIAHRYCATGGSGSGP
jgi:CheY-like chemotaxis protein